jgi:hypothetical protein
MRKYDKMKVTQSSSVSVTPTSVATSSESSSTETCELSIPIQLLNKLSTAQVIVIRKIMFTKSLYEKFVNLKHVYSEITPDEIFSLTSVTSEDGKRFYMIKYFIHSFFR